MQAKHQLSHICCQGCEPIKSLWGKSIWLPRIHEMYDISWTSGSKSSQEWAMADKLIQSHFLNDDSFDKSSTFAMCLHFKGLYLNTEELGNKYIP